MQVTGFDSVIFTLLKPKQVLRRLHKRLQSLWPNLSIDIDVEDTGDRYERLCTARECADAVARGVKIVLFAYRDPKMRKFMDKHAHDLDATGEGPISVHLRTRNGIDFSLKEVVEYRSREQLPFDRTPYPARLCAKRIWEISLVTPRDPDADKFSGWVRDQVVAVCMV